MPMNLAERPDPPFAHLLAHVQSPAQYVGDEWNIVRKSPADVALRVCLVYPDTYSIGMSCTAMHILYGTLNERPDVYAERAFMPWGDMADRLRAEGIPLCSLETYTPLRRFDLVGFSLQYEMTYANVLEIMELGGIPILARDRTESDPIVVAGGPCALNPEPVADFVDLFVLGEAEERIHDLADAYIEMKRSGLPTREERILEIARRVPNTYAPSFYEVRWDAQGHLESLAPRNGFQGVLPDRICRAVVEDFEHAYVPLRPIVPFVETVHDRITLEIMRGCTRGCRFCEAGMTRRPARWRSPGRLVEIAEAQYAATGHSQISLASLSSSDYPHLRELLLDLSRRFSNRKVSISLPSLRVSDQLRDLPGLLSGMKRSTLTIAPEAASARLRRVINKDISDDDLLRGVEAAYSMGWNHVKLYFMIGLPTETEDDVRAIADLALRVSRLKKMHGGGVGRVNLSVAGFVPKAHTPFERDGMATLEYLRECSVMLRGLLRSRAISLRIHRPERSVLEGVLARGDRRLGRVLLAAHRLGCRLDAWDEAFDFALWERAFSEAGIDPAFHAQRRREPDEVLPWSHIDAGVSVAFLRAERERAERGELTPDCRAGRCHACGAMRCPRATTAGASPLESSEGNR